MLTSTDALNEHTTFTYDGTGEMTSSTDQRAKTTQFACTNGDLTPATDPLGRVSTRSTDAVGRLIVSTSPLGQSSEYQYRLLNQVTEVVDPLGNATQFAYDGNGNLTSPSTDLALWHGQRHGRERRSLCQSGSFAVALQKVRGVSSPMGATQAWGDLVRKNNRGAGSVRAICRMTFCHPPPTRSVPYHIPLCLRSGVRGPKSEVGKAVES